MITTISNWGNSQGLRFPKSVMRELKLSAGDKLNMVIENQKIILEPMKSSRKKYSINELVANIPKDYLPLEEFSDKRGTEEW